jgi:hypothetical protein
MDPVVTLWASSLFGAACFSASGFLFGRSRTVPDSGEKTRDAALGAELESARYTNAELHRNVEEQARRAAECEQREVTARAALAKSEIDVQMLRRSLAEANAAVEAARSDTSKAREGTLDLVRTDAERKVGTAQLELRNETAARKNAEAKMRALEVQLAARTSPVESAEEKRLRAELSRLESDAKAKHEALLRIEAELRESHTSAKTNEAAYQRQINAHKEAAEEARARAASLTASLERLDREAASATHALRDSRHDLAMEVERLRPLGSQLDELVEENVRLKVAATEDAGMREELARANAEIQALRSFAFARPSATSITPVEEPGEKRHKTLPPRASTDTGSIAPTRDGQVLQRLVDRVGALPHVRVAVVTDTLGFLVAGGGEYGEALAAFGAFMNEVGARAARLLPLHAAYEVSIRDRQGVFLSTRLLDNAAQSDLSLVTLGVGEQPHKDVAKIIEQTPRVGL